MNIKGLDYNTQREAMMMPEYGREIKKMVEHAISLPTKEERLACARTIVKLMETKVPQIRSNSDYQQTLWDHLYLMSGKQLDIEWPFDVKEAEKIHAKPQPLKLPQTRIRLRHYGRLIEESIEKLKTMPDGAERDELIRLTANQMKRDLTQWSHSGNDDNEKVADDLARLTDGLIQIDLSSFRFDNTAAAPVVAPKKAKGKKRK